MGAADGSLIAVAVAVVAADAAATTGAVSADLDVSDLISFMFEMSVYGLGVARYSLSRR